MEHFARRTPGPLVSKSAIKVTYKSAAPVACKILLTIGLLTGPSSGEQASLATSMSEILTPASMVRIGTVDERYQSYAAALGPAYVRVSGTWANTTYFADSDHAATTPPPGFMGVLSRQQWKGVVDFAGSGKRRDSDVVCDRCRYS